MKRIQEKVKDIVEVRPYNSIRDFTADPAETLLNYHFTDATADLMAKWLDGIASVQAAREQRLPLPAIAASEKAIFSQLLAHSSQRPNCGRGFPNHMLRSVLSGFSGAIIRSLSSSRNSKPAGRIP